MSPVRLQIAAIVGCVVATAVGVPAVAQAQPMPAGPYVPIDRHDRGVWIAEGVAGPRSLFAIGALADVWQSGFNTPREWGRGWRGLAKRYAEREADVAISNTLEAGAGALWGEDPRYLPSHRHGIWPRARYAIETAFVAPRRDGHRAPAWGRLIGNVANNLIENVWLPSSVTTKRQTVMRSALGFAGRIGGDTWEEFWPDVRKHFIRRP